jgi:hypothetical protein
MATLFEFIHTQKIEVAKAELQQISDKDLKAFFDLKKESDAKIKRASMLQDERQLVEFYNEYFD